MLSKIKIRTFINFIFDIMYNRNSKYFYHNFVRVSCFVVFLHKIKHQRFNLKENRDAIRNLYSELCNEAIAVNRNVRFPEHILIDLDHSYISKLFNSLISALDTPDRYLESDKEFLNTNARLYMTDGAKSFKVSKDKL